MKENKANLPSDTYNGHLEIISGIKFTPREIDVIACLLGGRTSKSICQFLLIEEKTVETHKYNIMRKVDGNSKESIINFIEKSDKFLAIKKHYSVLLIQRIFEKRIQDILGISNKERIACSIVYWREEEKTFLVNQLKKHLKLAGCKVSLYVRNNYKSLNHLIHNLESQTLDYVIYIAPPRLLEQLRADDSKGKLEIFPFIQKVSQNPGSVIFLLNYGNVTTELPSAIQDVGYVSLEEQENYYFSVFEILKKVMPDRNIDKIKADFRRQYETIHDSSESLLPQIWPEIISTSIEESPKKPFFVLFSKKRKWGLFLGSVLFLSSACLIFYSSDFSKRRKITQSFQSQDLDGIRSDLPIPLNDTLLKRSKILAQIEEKLKSQEGIQTVALTGIGGVGKTTLARQYVYDKKASVIWEINAETKGSLMDSFEGLAYALSQTEEEKKMLSDLQDIKNPDEREEKIIILIKKRLKLHTNWFLVFDNVEKFSDIQKYFPSDSNVWGSGKVIVTTRDANIKNNSHIDHSLPIGELNQEEKSRLFMNIMGNEKSHTLSIQRNQTRNFLKAIPPFPLDISIAAYYIKTTNISYERYLENIRRYNKNFEDTQENILKGSIDYTHTRHNIITLSLQHIVDTQKDFGDLLVLISLLDSQNIPRDLLNLYKDKIIVDNFIYNLKKYSFITDVYFNAFHTISIHRCIQAIAIDYLKKIFLGARTEVIPSIVNTLENYAVDVINEENFLKIKILINHLELFLNHHDLLTNSMRGYIESKLGQAYSHIGYHVKAKSLLEESLVELKMGYNKNAIKIADILVYLGSIYRKLNHPSAAKTLLEESVTLYKKYLSESHANMAWALSHLGLIYRNLGDYEKAQELFKQSLLIYDKDLPKNQVRRTKTLSWLGFTHKELGNYKLAKDLLEESLILYKKHLSDSHINVAEVLEYLGFIHKEMGDHNEAKISFRQSLLIYEKLFSENSYKTSGVSERVGNLYRELGDYKMAKKFLEEHLLNHKKLPFGGYERAARGLKYLGIMYKETGHYDVAEDFLGQSLASYKKYYAQNYLEIARVLHKLGQVYLLQKGKNIEIAERYIVQSLEIFQKNKHPDSYLAFEDLASLHLKKSEDAQNKGHDQLSKAFKNQALQYLRQALEIVKFHFTKNSPHIIRIYSNIKALEP